MSNTDRDIKAIALDMVDAGLPSAFVLRVLELARASEGVEDLVHLWADAPDAEERREVEADLHGMIEDREPSGESLRVASADEGYRVLGTRREQKEHLRRLVEERGGVSEVARRAEMPQPSLSRLLNSMSEPRPATLNRLADAMGLPTSALLPQAVSTAPTEIVLGSPTAGPWSRRVATRLGGRVRRLERNLDRPTDRMEAA